MQVTLILKLVAALLKDEGARTPLHEIARRQCMQVDHSSINPAKLKAIYCNTTFMREDGNIC